MDRPTPVRAPGRAPGPAPERDRAATPAARPLRPLLLPGLRRLWRDRETLQLGRPPGRSVVLAGIDEPLRTTLSLLDGTRDAARLDADAGDAGCPPQRTAALVALLDDAGLLEDAAAAPAELLGLDLRERDRLSPDVGSLALLTRGRPAAALARRSAARVLVAGAGRVGAAVAAALAGTGLGALDVVDEGTARPADVGAGGLTPADVGRSRGAAARAQVQARAPSVPCAPLASPDLVVLAPARALDEALAADLVRRGVPHLMAEVRGEVGVVGPLVLPGRSACLQCLDLTRADNDPGWPWLAAQLGTAPAAPPACDAVLALGVAVQAAQQVLALLDEVAAPAAVDGTLEQVLPDWRWRRRSWTRHPACPCADVGLDAAR